MVEFDHVTKFYEDNRNSALNDVSFKVNKGEFVFIVGASGAGKSTLLKLILKEETPTKGRVLVLDKDISKLKRNDVPYLRRNIGIVFQDFRLIPTMNVYDNVAFALRVTNASNKEINNRVPYVLNLVNLADKAKRFPESLSGGEQQRVALARALVNNPKIIIADEPTGNIDPIMSHKIVDLLTEINKCGTTILMVTHEHELVSKYNHRIIVIKSGKLIADGHIGEKNE